MPMQANEALPLRGVRVLDLSNLLAGPMTGMFLADFGAEVIKVEHPSTSDGMRSWGTLKDNIGLFFKVINRNKKLITLDLHHEKAQAVVRRMIADVDVVIENFRPGTLERWGIGYADLAAINPGLVMARITGYGQDGPYASRRTLGTLAEAYSGLAYVSGYADNRPLLPPFGLGDSSTAITTAYGIMVALYNRDVRGGKGQVVDGALFDGLFTLLGPHVIDYDQTGTIQERGASAHVAPRNTYQTADGRWVVLSGGTHRTFERIANALGAGYLVDDPRFGSNPSRIENSADLDDELQKVIGALPYAELVARMEAAAAPIGPVMNVAQIFEDPQYEYRESIVRVPDDDFGSVRMQNVVPRLADTPGVVVKAGGSAGSDNDEVLATLGGLSPTEIDDLRKEGIS
jgi:formyl-CoA transferase